MSLHVLFYSLKSKFELSGKLELSVVDETLDKDTSALYEMWDNTCPRWVNDKFRFTIREGSIIVIKRSVVTKGPDSRLRLKGGEIVCIFDRHEEMRRELDMLENCPELSLNNNGYVALKSFDEFLQRFDTASLIREAPKLIVSRSSFSEIASSKNIHFFTIPVKLCVEDFFSVGTCVVLVCPVFV